MPRCSLHKQLRLPRHRISPLRVRPLTATWPSEGLQQKLDARHRHQEWPSKEKMRAGGPNTHALRCRTCTGQCSVFIQAGKQPPGRYPLRSPAGFSSPLNSLLQIITSSTPQVSVAFPRWRMKVVTEFLDRLLQQKNFESTEQFLLSPRSGVLCLACLADSALNHFSGGSRLRPACASHWMGHPLRPGN